MRFQQSFSVAAGAVAAMAIALFGTYRVLVGDFDSIELHQSADKALQASRALQADLNQLAVSTRDYAEWDDAQQYIRDREVKFIEANFSFASLQGMAVDRMAIIGPDGDIWYAAGVDQTLQRMVIGLPRGLAERITSLRAQASMLRQLPATQRMLRTDEGLLAFSILEITRSDHSAASGAFLFFGRLIEADEVERMRQTSQLPAELRSIAPGSAPVSQANFSIMSGAKHVIGYAIVSDWRHEPLAEIRVATPRAIGTLGRRTTAWLMVAIGTLAIACAALFLVMAYRERRHWQRQLALQQRHERILAGLDECIVLVDPVTRRIIECNTALTRTLGFTRDEILQRDVKQVFVDFDERLLAFDDAAGGLRNCRLRARDGHLIECEINVTQLADEHQWVGCVIARDITQRRLAEQRLQENQSRLAHVAEHDLLTGLPNRHHLDTCLPALLHRCSLEERSLALLYVDLDHFKHINESRSHGFGDQLLKIIALRLRAEISAENILLRIGGDEFVIAAPLESNAMRAESIAQRLLTAINAPITHDGSSISIEASIGIALYPRDGLDGETLLKHADIALYQAKAAGRNCYAMFSHDMNVQLSEHVVLEQSLRRALNTEQIHVAYQAVVDLQSGRLVSFEALARWNHPDMGPVPPGRFIPVAERSGLIVALGEQIVHTVIAQLREWQDAGLTLAPIAINVAPIQFERTDFTTFVHETAFAHDIDPRLVAFEVTESALLQDSSKHIVMLDTLRHAGSRIYIDDFGTGFSNLGYLKTLPADAVKIDQSFVQ